MKTVTYSLFALAIGFASSASAASVTVSAGLPAAGIVFQTDYMPLEGYQNTSAEKYYFQVGNYDTGTSIWTAFGAVRTIVGDATMSSMELKTGTTAVAAAAPASLQNLPIHVWVGAGDSVANSLNGSWVILGSTVTTNPPKFPADITANASVTFAASTQAAVTVLASGNADNGFIVGTAPSGASAGFNLVTVPEPSTALLGLIGLAGLVRRRR